MKTSTVPALRQLALAGAAILLLAAAPGRARAAFILRLTQSGGNVVVNGSGSFNTTALTLFDSSSPGSGYIQTGYAYLIAGPATSAGSDFDSYNGGGLTGPTAFGTGNNFSASSGTGGFAGIQAGSGSPILYVPQGYTSGTLFTDSSTFTGQTFTTLGFTPGTYTYTWGSVANGTFDSLTVTSVAPEPSTWALLGVGAGLLGLILRRRATRV